MPAHRAIRTIACLLLMTAAVTGCGTLRPPAPSNERSHLLEPSRLPAAVAAPAGAPVLAVSPVRPGPLLQDFRMLYRRDGLIAPFANNRWAAAPEQLVGRWMVEALERGGGLAAVIGPGGRGRAGLRLDTELVSIYQDFGTTPSRLRLEVRCELVAVAANRVVATRRLIAVEPVLAENPDGGAAAAGRALGSLLDELVRFVRDSLPAVDPPGPRS